MNKSYIPIIFLLFSLTFISCVINKELPSKNEIVKTPEKVNTKVETTTNSTTSPTAIPSNQENTIPKYEEPKPSAIVTLVPSSTPEPTATPTTSSTPASSSGGNTFLPIISTQLKGSIGSN
ncbi:MAG: hypothetical protein U0457_08795 [Candidatus Sericytochromatia bacterium]